MVTWVRAADGGCTIEVRVLPRSSRTGVEVRGEELLLRVHAPPEAGRATKEAGRALAAALRVAPSAVTLHRGARARRKVFRVAGRLPDQAERLLGEAAAGP